jgi:hypothetical protein
MSAPTDVADPFTTAPTAERLALAGPYATGLRPLAFRLSDGRALSFASDGAGSITVSPGVAEGATIAEVTPADWSAFVAERLTRYGLLYGGKVSFAEGSFEDLCHWEPALRALWEGRPVFDPARLDLTDDGGRPLDLTRRFTLDDDDAGMARFLQQTGYLHVGAVFSPDEVDALQAEVARMVDEASPSDGNRSWWTRTAEGEAAVCQLKYAALESELVERLHDDPRLQRILAASGVNGLVPNLDRMEGTKIILKHPGASEGLTDLPFHTDCGMGMHPHVCPMVLIGVQLDAATPETGQVHMVAGSHRTTTPDASIVGTEGWPVAAIATEAGDVTVHFSHTLHAAPPPVGGAPGRRTVYACYGTASLFAALDPLEDLVSAINREDGVSITVDELLES